MALRETDKGAAGIRVGVRRPLAGEVGQEREPFDTWLPALRLGDQGTVVLTGCRDVSEPAKRSCRREHDAHRMPAARDGVTERVHPPLFVRLEAREGREDDARRPEHDRDRTGTVDAHAECAGRLIPCSGGDGHSVPRLPRHRGRLEQSRQPLGGKIQRGQDLLAPTPMRDVEQQGSRGVGHVGRTLAGQAETDVVLREHDVRDPRVDLRLVAREPEELWRRESCERAVSCQREEPLEPDPILDLGALGRCSLVVPEDRRAQHLVLGVDARRARASGPRGRCRRSPGRPARQERPAWPATSPPDPAPTIRAGATRGRIHARRGRAPRRRAKRQAP